MAAIYFPKTDVLKRALIDAVIPAAVATTCLRFAPGADGGIWLDSDVALPREVLNLLRRLGARTKGQESPPPAETLMCWAQALPLERSERSGPALVELTEARRLPHLMAELRRFNCANAEWLIDDAGTAWVRIDNPPSATLFRADVDPSMRIYVEQSPEVWVARGWRHPLPRPYQTAAGSLMLMRPERKWRTIAALPLRGCVLRFPINLEMPIINDRSPATSVSVKPRLVTDREAGTAELWVLSDETKLFDWLAGADDRLVARLEVARFEVDGATKVVLLSRGGHGGPPVLVLDADVYRPYMKLPNLFLPVGKKLAPPLRRDLAKRAFAPSADYLAWLHQAGSMAALPLSAFRPLRDCVRYQQPIVQPHVSITSTPAMAIDAYEAKERRAGERIKIAAVETLGEKRLTMTWDRDQWRLVERGKP